MENISKMCELIDVLNKAADSYYNSDTLLMSDREFDNLFDELKNLETESELILSNSPTSRVGHEVKSKLEKVQHDIPLLSLDKTKSIDALNKFIGDKDVVLMLKGDGLTNEIIYDNGKLIKGSTRGNGFIGEDISHNVKVFNNLPLTIEFKGYLKIAGEAVIFDKDFEEINKKENGKYENSRNLVAGSVRQLNSEICATRKVNFMAFSILEAKYGEYDVQFDKFTDQLNFLGELGFYIIPHGCIDKTVSLELCIQNMQELAQDLGIPIDGIVLKFNDLSYGKNLGATEHHPLDAIAFKFYDEEFETGYIKTEWNTSRTGRINPVAIFEPVNIEGSTVGRATLHNLDYFEQLQLGKGDRITVIKANKVIPKVIGNLTRAGTEVIPEECPVCHAKTEIKLLKISRVLQCTNEECPSRKIAQFEHFCSRNAMNIVGLSEATLETFINKGFIKTLPDIYKLRRYEDQIIKLDGFGQRSYDNIIEAIDASKNCKFENFLLALGIPQIGKGTAKIIATYFKSLANFAQAIAKHFDFSTIDDIGQVTNEFIYSWFSIRSNKDMMFEIFEHIDIEVVTSQETQVNVFQGKTMVVTGTLKNYTRDSIQEKLLSLGIKNTGTVSKKTDYVLVGEKPGASKYNKAIDLGIRILSEEEFESIIN